MENDADCRFRERRTGSRQMRDRLWGPGDSLIRSKLLNNIYLEGVFCTGADCLIGPFFLLKLYPSLFNLTMPVMDNNRNLAAAAIYNTTDKEEVKRLMDKDPAIMAGVFTYVGSRKIQL
jgi:hypothetical protein